MDTKRDGSSFFRQFHVGAEQLQPGGAHAAIGELIDNFVEAVQLEADRRGLARTQVRLLRRLHLFVDVDARSVHLVFTNEAAMLASSKFYLHEQPELAHPLNDAVQAAVFQAGFPSGDTTGLSLPRRLLQEGGEKRKQELTEFARAYIDDEFTYLERRSRYVSYNPIFRGRGFEVDPNLCFVLMPFAPGLQPVYEDHISKAIVDAGLRSLRADDIFSNREIVEDIWEHINRARVVVAELTGRNPNVYYEVGVAHTVGKEVILVSQSLDDIPFDLRHLRVILYEHTPRGCSRLEQDLTATIRSVTSGHSSSALAESQ